MSVFPPPIYYRCDRCGQTVDDPGLCPKCHLSDLVKHPPAHAAGSTPPIQEVGRKNDAGKDRWSLVPDEIDDVVRVLAVGAASYGDHNWKLVKDAKTRYFDALMRHVRLWKRGEVIDKESGLPHMAHIVCNALFLAHFDKESGG